MRPIDADAFTNAVALYMAENAYLNDTALDVLKKVSKWLEEAPTIDYAPRQQWISVEERLPEDCEDVLVLVGGNVDVGYHSQCGFWECYSYRNNNVTHWMPLPEPPKEE